MKLVNPLGNLRSLSGGCGIKSATAKTFDYDAKTAQARAGTGAVRIAARRPTMTVAITAAA
jgi:hypothetical protein